MAGGNLTRDEASERARVLTVERYEIELDLTVGDKIFRTKSRVFFDCSEPGASTFLDLLAPTVHSVTLNGVTLEPHQVFDGSRITLTGLASENEVVIDADGAYSHTGEGLHRFVDPVDDAVYTYTQFEPADARRLYANFEQPDLKASFEFRSPPRRAGGSGPTSPSGRRSSVRTAPGSGASRRPSRSPPTSPPSSPGPYHFVEDHYYLPPRRRRRAGDPARRPVPPVPRAVLRRRRHLRRHQARPGLLPRELRLPVPVREVRPGLRPEYNLGAMENPGLVTFNESFIFRSKTTDAAYQSRAGTILHEMAHMWFGDLVTMKWWDDLWLKESFADFMGSFACAEATRWTDEWVAFANRRKAWAYRQDQLPTTHPITADIRDLEDAKLNFDGITYAKGASVLKQLVAYVGREEFLEGVRRYFKRHAYGNTTLADLLSALEETSGRDLTAWSKAWLETAGVNSLTPGVEVDSEGLISSYAIRQTAPPEFPTLRQHRIAVGSYAPGDSGEPFERVEHVRARHRRRAHRGAATGRPADLAAGPAQRPGPHLREELLRRGRSRDVRGGGIGSLRDPMARALCWSGLWHMTRDGALPGRRFVDIVLGNIARETDIGVLQNLLRQMKQVRDYYLEPAHRPVAAAGIGQAMWSLLSEAEAGSDHQLAYAYAAAWASSSDADLQRLSELLSGSSAYAGLDVDQDLRWAYLEALAAAGLDDDGSLATAEVSRDDTAAGRRHRATAFASRPLADAKAEAWRQAVETPDQPNELIVALLTGFEQPGQEDLLEPYVEPYFDGLSAVWEERSIENADRIVTFGYPGLLASPTLLARTDAWLAGSPTAPALRRLVLELRDDTARGLRAQACDAEITA